MYVKLGVVIALRIPHTHSIPPPALYQRYSSIGLEEQRPYCYFYDSTTTWGVVGDPVGTVQPLPGRQVQSLCARMNVRRVVGERRGQHNARRTPP